MTVKAKRRLVLIAFLAVWAMVLLLLLNGCANLETSAYRTIGATTVTVDQTMNGWGDYVRAGLATDTEQTRVKRLYEQYQASMRVAKVAVMSAKAAPNEQEAYRTAIDVLDASRIELVNAILTFTKD